MNATRYQRIVSKSGFGESAIRHVWFPTESFEAMLKISCHLLVILPVVPQKNGFSLPSYPDAWKFCSLLHLCVCLASAVGLMLSANWQCVKHDISIASCLVKAQDHISGFLRTFPRVDHWVNGGAKGKQTHLELCFHVFLLMRWLWFSLSTNLDGRRGEGDHLDPCLTGPVLDLCTCGHFVLKLGCLSKDGWTGIIYLSLEV